MTKSNNKEKQGIAIEESFSKMAILRFACLSSKVL